ncbi:MAG: hypothetical protein WEA10_06720 [Actinomycetota bacterium]
MTATQILESEREEARNARRRAEHDRLAARAARQEADSRLAAISAELEPLQDRRRQVGETNELNDRIDELKRERLDVEEQRRSAVAELEEATARGDAARRRLKLTLAADPGGRRAKLEERAVRAVTELEKAAAALSDHDDRVREELGEDVFKSGRRVPHKEVATLAHWAKTRRPTDEKE